MSADQWRVCPRCHKRQADEYQAKLDFASVAYGQVPPDEYVALLDEAAEHKPFNQPFELEGKNSTLRIDYETYFNGNFLHFRYSAYCVADGCDWKMRVNETWEVPDA